MAVIAPLAFVQPKWSVLSKQFSAVTIGIGFQDAYTGYTSFTDGASAPKIGKTINGGANWTEVNSTGTVLIPMGFAAAHTDTSRVATCGLAASQWSAGRATQPTKCLAQI